MEATAKGSGGDGGESEREKLPPFVRRGGQKDAAPGRGRDSFGLSCARRSLSRPDTLMVMVGGGHFLLIIACLAGFLQLQPR